MIGIIGAMQVEVEILKENLIINKVEKCCGMEFYVGSINKTSIVLVQCGVGKVNAAIATTIMIDRYGCSLIINTGIAGGISGVNTKDIVIGDKLKYSDYDITIFGYEYGQVPGFKPYFEANPKAIDMITRLLTDLGYEYKIGTIYSQDQFVSSLEQLSKVEITPCAIAEMEGCAIAHVCVKSGVDFIVLRYISDVVGAPNQINDFMAFEEEMANRSSNICLEVLRNYA